MSIAQMLFGSAGVAPGSQTVTSTASFVVPLYNSLVVTIEGSTGATGGTGADATESVADGDTVTWHGGAGGTGGIGGKCIKTYTSGTGPSPGASVTCTIASADGGTNQFTFGANPRALNGSTGSNGQDAGYTVSGDDIRTYYNGAAGSTGTNGTATAGDTNTTGGSGSATAKITLTWS